MLTTTSTACFRRKIKQPVPPMSELEGLSIDGVGQAQDDGAYLGGRNRSLPNLGKQGADGNLSARG
jgi:hypothetical protein